MITKSAELARSRRRVAAERAAMQRGQASLFGDPIMIPQDAASSPPRRESTCQPFARRSDPLTSHLAAQGAQRTPVRNAVNQRILDFLAISNQPKTYREISIGIVWPDADVMRRLNRLRKAGLVVKRGERECTTNGNRMATWEAS